MYFKQTLIITLSFFILLKENTCRVVQHSYIYRDPRSCKQIAVTEHATHVPLWVLIFLLIFMSVLCLMILGVIKGILGLFCCAPVGMWGLGALIDLPRPLECYQEPNLASQPVVYDDTGWPVHPQTRKRSVRALTKKTEFYLNIIFFLTYPLAMIVSMCSACCFKENPDCENQCFRCVNTIVFAECTETTKDDSKKDKPQKKGKKKSRKDIYEDGDSAEDKDTNYVVYQMHHSQQSLQVHV